MSEQTPQDIMSEKMSQMGRIRAGKSVKPTMTEQIKEHGKKMRGEPSRRDKMAAMRQSISPADKKTRTYRAKRDELLKETASKPTTQKSPHDRRYNNG